MQILYGLPAYFVKNRGTYFGSAPSFCVDHCNLLICRIQSDEISGFGPLIVANKIGDSNETASKTCSGTKS